MKAEITHTIGLFEIHVGHRSPQSHNPSLVIDSPTLCLSGAPRGPDSMPKQKITNLKKKKDCIILMHTPLAHLPSYLQPQKIPQFIFSWLCDRVGIYVICIRYIQHLSSNTIAIRDLSNTRIEGRKIIKNYYIFDKCADFFERPI